MRSQEFSVAKKRSFKLLSMLSGWKSSGRPGHALALSDRHMLRDIGLEPGDAARMAGRPFWDTPTNWKI
jgi:uncharacterized protein YjiS (DUF1127 family)